ncbi:hypothetical protein EL09_22405 [Salmonella enterica subsp. enterica]|nr:hypothetical protein [Salmonella enterica subsp. enterica]
MKGERGRSRFTGFPYTPAALPPGCRERRTQRDRGRRDRNGRSKPAVDVATGMETRCPEGAGQRQHRWLGAKHDSPGSRQGSRPAQCLETTRPEWTASQRIQ